MSTVRLQLRFLLPMAIAVGVAALLSLLLMGRLELNWFSRDLDMRGALVSDALSDSIGRAVRGPPAEIEQLRQVFDRTVRDERLVALALCTPQGQMLGASGGFPQQLSCAQAQAIATTARPQWQLPGGMVHVGWYAVEAEAAQPMALVLLHDLSFIERRSSDTRLHLVALIVGLGLVISVITMVVAQLNWRRWITGARALLRGEGVLQPNATGLVSTGAPELEPLARDLRERLRDLEDEYRRSLGPDESQWTPERLRALLQRQLRGEDVIVVSNREPYLHEQSGDDIVVRRPASGLVTALEPVMRACSGTWVAHGSGSADRKIVDAADRVAVPPDRSALHAAPRVADARGRAGLLLRLLQRRHVAAVPCGPCAAGVPRVRLAAVPGRQPALRRCDRRRRRAARTRWCWCRTTTSRCCRRCCARGCRARRS